MRHLSLRVQRPIGGLVLGSILALLAGQAGAQNDATSDLPQQGAETMEVVVRGHAESSTFDDERGTQIVTDGQITEAHATSLADAVRQTPGLSVGQTTPGQGTIYVRGLSGRAVAHSVDGVRLNAAIFRAGNNPYLGLIDPYSLHRISAVPGAASVEFGSDALGGALLFSTVVPGFTARGTQDAMRWEQHFSSNPLGATSHVDWTHRTRYVSFHAGLTYLTASDVRPGEGRQTPNASSYVGLIRPSEDKPYRPQTQVAQWGTAFDFVAANATLHAKMASFGVIARAQLGMRPNLNRYDRITPRFQGSVPSRYEASVEPMTRNMGSLTFSHRAPQGLYKGSELMLAWQRLREATKDRAYDEVCTVGNDFADSRCQGALQLVPAGTERREMNRSDAFTARFVSTLLPASSFTLRAGFEVRTDIITSTADSYDHTAHETTEDLSRYPSGSTSNEGGLFAKGEYRSKRLSFFAGVRAMGFWLDIQRRADSPGFEHTLLDYSAELGIRVLIFSPLALVVNTGRGVRMPNVADFSALGPRAQGRYQVPNAHIGAEHSWTVDSGLKMRSKGWILDTFVFATRYDDAIILLPTRVAGQEFTAGGERYYHSENAARVDYIGVDVSGAVPLGRAARLWGRWLALLGQQTNPPDSTAPRRTPADRVPPGQGELGVDVEPWDRWTFKLWSRFRLKQDRLNEPTNLDDNRIPEGGTPGYITLHAQAEFAMRHGLEALLSLDNLTNALVLDHGSGFYGPGFAATLGLRFDGNVASHVEHHTHE